VRTQVRGNFTVKTLSDKLASTVTLATNIDSNNDGVMKERAPQLLNELNAFDSDYLSLVPYVDLRMRNKTDDGQDQGITTELGLKPELKHPAIVTAVGDLNFSLSAEADVLFRTKKVKGVTKKEGSDRSTGFSLVENFEEKENSAAVPEVMYVPAISLDMNRVFRGLSLTTFAEYYNTYVPVVEMTEDSSGNTDKIIAYQPVRDVISYVGASYKVTDKLSITETIQFHHNGFYEESGDRNGNQVVNYLKVAYTLY
jgi:hypothetical protein